MTDIAEPKARLTRVVDLTGNLYDEWKYVESNIVVWLPHDCEATYTPQCERCKG